MSILRSLANQAGTEVGSAVLIALSKARLHGVSDIQALRGGTTDAGLHQAVKALAGPLPEPVEAELLRVISLCFFLNNIADYGKPAQEVQVDHRPKHRVPEGRLQSQAGAGHSLREREHSLREKQIDELVDIVDEAGPAAKLRSEIAALGGDSGHLLRTALSRNAHGTMEGHLLRWRVIVRWAAENNCSPYPLSTENLIRYLDHRHSTGCGPSVPIAVRGTCTWIAKKIRMACPDTNHDLVRAIEDKVIEARGQEVKEAAPLPEKVLQNMEKLVLEGAGTPKVIFAWWVLCMVYASLRYDDACHVHPSKLLFDGEALRGTSWQTKKDRRRRGTAFAVANSGFAHPGWLEHGWNLFKNNLMHDSDYWMPRVYMQAGAVHLDASMPLDYSESMKVLRNLVAELMPCTVEQASVYTWHSCKTTVIDMAAHQEENPMAIGLQGHWKDPMGAMPLKYTRKRMALPLAMVRRMCAKLGPRLQAASASSGPAAPPPQPQEPVAKRFIIPGAALRGRHQSIYHVQSTRCPGRTLCGGQLEHMVETTSLADSLCARCARKGQN